MLLERYQERCKDGERCDFLGKDQEGWEMIDQVGGEEVRGGQLVGGYLYPVAGYSEVHVLTSAGLFRVFTGSDLLLRW